MVVGLPKPEYAFSFAEGHTGADVDEFLAISNAHGSLSANVTVQDMYPGGGSLTKTYSLGPKRRLTLNIRLEAGDNQAVSIKVTSNAPIVAERPMYFSYYSLAVPTASGGHIAMGYSP